MNRTARVTSIEAVRAFKASLQRYQEVVQDCLDHLSGEVRRGLNWIESDRMPYWPVQLRESSDALAEAKNALSRKQIVGSTDDHRPACYEEKKAVEVAKRRRRYCEDRLANTKHWLRTASHEAEEFKGLLGNLAQLAQTDLPKAIARLEKLATSLEKYASTQAAGSDSNSTTIDTSNRQPNKQE